MKPQTQQPTEGGGSNKPAESSANMLCKRSSTRWTPITDQIRILKELYYNKGVRYPIVEQIQRICLQLKRYGVEGKNVFYWFQNHKARERQRKKSTSDVHMPIQMRSYGGYGSMNMEKSFRDCSILAGGGTSSTGVGGSISHNFGSWVGCSVDPYSSSSYTTCTSTTFFDMNEEQTFMEQRGEDHQEIETLPMFPKHGGDIFGNVKTTSEGGCGSRTSLKLSLNSYGSTLFSREAVFSAKE